jgi:hypothetical protein
MYSSIVPGIIYKAQAIRSQMPGIVEARRIMQRKDDPVLPAAINCGQSMTAQQNVRINSIRSEGTACCLAKAVTNRNRMRNTLLYRY